MATDLFAILLGVVLVNGFVLPAFPALAAPAPGIAALLALPRLALLTPLVAAPATLAGWLVERLLLRPLRLGELQPLVVLVATLAIARLACRAWDALQRAPRPVPEPLLAFNATAAGLAVGASIAPATAAGAVLAGAGAGAVLGMLNFCFTGLRERLDAAELPEAWRGAGIALVTAGILSLGLGGLAGIWRG